LRAIRKSIKVLLITGYTDKMDPGLFADAEPTGVIHKPFSTSDFLATLKAALAAEAAS
jgi:DNA-binding response OmpR family regulator